MKKLVLLSFFIFSLATFAQVGINTTTPNAQLDIKSSNQATPTNTDGLLIPKVDVFPATNPTALQQGMMVYLTTVSGANQPGFYSWDNVSVSWKSINDSNGWSTSGNSGTNPATNFIGTIDSQPFKIKVNGISSGIIDYVTSGSTGFGYNALSISSNGSSFNNTAYGYNALKGNTPSFENTAIGFKTLTNSGPASYRNTAVGSEALSNNQGQGNTGIGAYSLSANTSGRYNVGIGVSSLGSNTIGEDNIGIGLGALAQNTTGNKNIGIGSGVNQSNPSGNDNVGIGYNALTFNSTNELTAIGSQSLFYNTTGTGNTAIGFQSLFSNTTGRWNTAIGHSALAANTSFGYGNTAVGFESLKSNTISEFNTSIGTQAMHDNTTGTRNVAIGTQSLYHNVSGSYNVAIGPSLGYNISGYNNIGIGFSSLVYNTTGNNNIAIGINAIYFNSNCKENTAIGNFSLRNGSTGNYLTATGFESMHFNTGDSNSAFGHKALYSNTSGFRNVGFGKEAFSNNQTGNFNTAVGSYANVTFATNPSNSSCIGDGAIITASNQIRLGDGGVSSIGGFANWTNVSDKRFKKDIQQNVPGLDFIKKLKPVTYHLDTDAIAGFLKTPDSLRKKESELVKGKMLQTGFIAQEVEAAAKELNYDFSGVDAPKNEHDFYGLRYAEFVVPLVKAVQELAEQNAILKTEIEKLKLNNKVLSSLLQDVAELKKNLVPQLNKVN